MHAAPFLPIRPIPVAVLLWGTLIGVSCRAATPTPLSRLSPLSAAQGWGTLQKDRSVSEQRLRIGDRTFDHGLGTHAPSRIIYELGGRSERFEAWVGVDAAMRQQPDASVIFKVLADEHELFNSGVMKADTPARRVSVPLAGINELALVVSDAGDTATCDHADWADAVLLGVPRPAYAPPPRQPARFRVRTEHLTLQLSADGGIVGATLGPKGLKRPVQGGTVLVGCTNVAAISARKGHDGGFEFTRLVMHAPSGQRARVTDRFIPAKDSVRWEIEVLGDGAAWSTGIETRLHWPSPEASRFWTAWEDPDQERGRWHDPLQLRPLRDSRWWYGAPRWEEEDRLPRFPLTGGDGFVIPLATLVEPGRAIALTLALSPEDPLLDLSLTTRQDGACVFARHSHRVSATNRVRDVAFL